MRKPISKLVGNIIEHTKLTREYETQIRNYYHWDSLLMKAIHKHIGYAEECVLIPRNHDIKSYSECGPSVNYSGIQVFSTQYGPGDKPYEVDFFNLEISVEFIDEDDRSFTKNFTLRVPIDLEVNFTEEKFAAWINELAVKKKKEDIKSDREKFEALKKAHPEWD